MQFCRNKIFFLPSLTESHKKNRLCKQEQFFYGKTHLAKREREKFAQGFRGHLKFQKAKMKTNTLEM